METQEEDSAMYVDFWGDNSSNTFKKDIVPLSGSLSSLISQSSISFCETLTKLMEEDSTDCKEIVNMERRIEDEFVGEKTTNCVRHEAYDSNANAFWTLDPAVADCRNQPSYELRISNACRKLNIVNDPCLWSAEDVQVWCDWVLSQYQVNPARREMLLKNFCHNGASLCQIQQEAFVHIFQKAGNYIYSELELWKNAAAILSAKKISGSLTSTTATPVNMISTDRTCTNSTLASSNPPSSQLTIPTFVLNSVLSDECSDGIEWAESWQTPENVDSRPATNGRQSFASDMDSVDSEMSFDSKFFEKTQKEELHPSDTWQPYAKQSSHLWQFLKELLQQPSLYEDCIRWLDRRQGIFKIVDSVRVAKLWGERKDRPTMNYDKLSRSIRQYYKKGIIQKTRQSKRLVYQFCPRYAS